MPKVVDKQAKRNEITAAAMQVFARHGFQGASVDEVAAAAGVSKGTVYGYFESKEMLFFATFEAFQAQVTDELLAAMADGKTVREQLVRGLTTMASTLCSHIELYPLTLEVWAAASSGPTRKRFSAAMQGLYKNFRELTAGLIKAGKASGEFHPDVNEEAVAGWLVGGMDGLILQAWFDADIDVETWTEDFLQTILRGISADREKGEK